MNNLPSSSETELEEYLERLEREVNRKMRARLPKLELAPDQIANLEKRVRRYAADIEHIFDSRGFRPHPSVVWYISLKAMYEAVSLSRESRYRDNFSSEDGWRRAVSARTKEGVDETIKAFNEAFKDLTGEELLFSMLTKPPERAVGLIEFSTLEQAGEMARLLATARTGGKSAFYQPKGDPHDGLEWLLQHLYVRIAKDPKVREEAEPLARQGTKLVFAAPLPSRKASGRGGGSIDYAVPINAQILERLGREINKHIRPVKDHGVSSIARRLRKDRSAVRRYLKEDLLLEMKPDGKGELDTRLSAETVFRSMEASTPKKPGPKTEGRPLTAAAG